jgi:hypothetical protein
MGSRIARSLALGLAANRWTRPLVVRIAARRLGIAPSLVRVAVTAIVVMRRISRDIRRRGR